MAPCSTALKYFQYPAGEWDRSSCLLSSFRSLTVPILPFTHTYTHSLSLTHTLTHSHSLLSSSIYPSIRAPGSPSRLPLPRVHSCLLVARTSLPTVNGSFSFSPCRRFAPLLEILVAWRSSLSYSFTSITCSSFLRSLFTRYVSEIAKRCTSWK